MVPLSKSGVQQCTVGSNPTLSADGEVLEWPIRRAWRARVAQATVGSNPTLSATVLPRCGVPFLPCTESAP